MISGSRRSVAALLMLVAICTSVDTAIAAGVPNMGTSRVDQERLTLERQRVMLEETKAKQEQINEAARIQLERDKLKVEQEKANIEREKGMWAAVASVVPLVAVLLTVAFGVWTSAQQMRLQTVAQADAAKLAFEIKAAEIAFAAKSPEAVLNRGKALKAMFGTRLPDSFLQSFVPHEVAATTEPATEKLVLMGLLAEHVEDADKIIAYWQRLFPGDESWLRRLLEPSVMGVAPSAESETRTG